MVIIKKKFAPLCVAIFFGIIVSYGGISTRIAKTGWANFPDTLLDWSSIIGAAGILLFLIVLIFCYSKTENKNKIKSHESAWKHIKSIEII